MERLMWMRNIKMFIHQDHIPLLESYESLINILDDSK